MSLCTLGHACAASKPVSALFTVPPSYPTCPQNQPISGNVLDNAQRPAGTTASLTGMSIEGTRQVLPLPGTGAVTLNAPGTVLAMGTLELRPDGSYTFTPVSGYVGPAPAVNLYALRSDGQSTVSSITIDVVAGEARRGCTRILLACVCVCVCVCRALLCMQRPASLPVQLTVGRPSPCLASGNKSCMHTALSCAWVAHHFLHVLCFHQNE
jgi:hypothetical protein